MSIKTADFPRAEDTDQIGPIEGDADHVSSRRNLKDLKAHEAAQATDQERWSDEKPSRRRWSPYRPGSPRAPD